MGGFTVIDGGAGGAQLTGKERVVANKFSLTFKHTMRFGWWEEGSTPRGYIEDDGNMPHLQRHHDSCNPIIAGVPT